MLVNSKILAFFSCISKTRWRKDRKGGAEREGERHAAKGRGSDPNPDWPLSAVWHVADCSKHRAKLAPNLLFFSINVFIFSKTGSSKLLAFVMFNGGGGLFVFWLVDCILINIPTALGNQECHFPISVTNSSKKRMALLCQKKKLYGF